LSSHGFAFRDIAVEVSDGAIVKQLLQNARIDLEEVRAKVRAHDLSASESLLVERGVTLPRGRMSTLEGAMSLSDALRRRARELDDLLLAPLAQAFPEASFELDFSRLEGLGYYVGPCIRIGATSPDGVRLPLSDGGVVPWTGRLLGDARELLVTSGVGSDLVCARFRGHA
jgi:hypothetical protein